MDSLGDCNQATLVPGSFLTDKVLLSHERVNEYERKGVSPR